MISMSCWVRDDTETAAYMIVEKLFDDRMACLARRNHFANRGNRLTLDEYVSMKHMLISRTEPASA